MSGNQPGTLRRIVELVAAMLAGALLTLVFVGDATDPDVVIGENPRPGSPPPSAAQMADASSSEPEVDPAARGSESSPPSTEEGVAGWNGKRGDGTVGSRDEAAIASLALVAELEGRSTQALLGDLQQSWKAQRWPRAKVLAKVLAARIQSGNGTDELLGLLGDDADVTTLRTLAALLGKGMLELDEAQALALQEGVVALIERSHDGELERTASKLLQGWLRREDAPELDDELAARLYVEAAAPGETASRRSLLELLRREAGGHPAALATCGSILEHEPSPELRVAALRSLRQTRDPRVDELLLATLQREQDPRVLWEASSAANFLTQPTASRSRYKDAYRGIVRGSGDDIARGRAAQSLALLATLDGDAQVPDDLRTLAATTADPLLAEFAQRAAAELESGSASIRSLGEAWETWHRSLDRERYP